MRFLELSLKAFGSFSERAPIEFLDADAGGPGLCVLYGANEAGKSTALRAIRGLLYGIPAKTSDDFIHRYAQLRIGARLRFDDGEEIAVMRHKKNKDSLYSYDDRDVFRSERLESLVEAVPEALFARFYGLDHPGLRQGSAALLQDDGEVGRALFGAGLGVANLHSVLDRLEQDAAALFAPRASKPRLSARLAEYDKARKEIGLGALDPKVWAAQEDSVGKAATRAQDLARELEDDRRELSRLERLKRSQPGLARRRQAKLRLEERTSVAPLPDDFAERLTTARADRRGGEQARLRTEAKIEREAAARDQLTLAPELLAERERIESLHQQVGGYQEAVDQLPRRESKLAAIDEEIESLLFGTRSELDPERLAALRHAVAQASQIRTLANDGLKLDERLAKTREEASEAEAELARLRGQANASPDSEAGLDVDTNPLRQALGRCVKLGPIDEGIDEARRRYEEIEFEVERQGRALGVDADPAAVLDAAAFPGHELIDAMAERFATLARRREALGEEVRKVGSERRGVDEGLARIQSQGILPQLADLEAQRGTRDRTWRELRRGVIDGASQVMDTARGLADRFEQESAGADATGDRLRVDAERVAEQGALGAKAARLDLELAELLERQKRLDEEELALGARWSAAWAPTGVAARAPEEMRGWRRAFDTWWGLVGKRREAGLALERDLTAQREAMSRLQSALVGLPGWGAFDGQRVDEWVSRAETVLETLDAASETRRRTAEKLAQIEERAAQSVLRQRQAEAAVSEWREGWNRAVAILDLAGEATRPEAAIDRLDEMKRLLERLRERDELADRVEKMKAQIAAFEADVRQVVESCAPELAEYPCAPATQRMQRMLGDALNQQALFGKGGEALAEATEELEEAIAGMRASEESILGLRALAGVEEESDLDEALRLWREVEEARSALGQAETELLNLADGRSIEALEAATVDLDVDALAAQIASLEERIDRTTRDEKAAIEELRSQRDALEKMDGTDRIAELAELAESQLAEIRRDVDRYVELRMAKQILEREIERYRQENQAPLLKRAGEIFGALTRGAYPRVESDVDQGLGEVRLLAVDPDNRHVPVSGLSSGTRDQLFLAIRLASFEEATARGESMPLIADDILIEFDDARSRATLEVLAEMGRKNQILLFSHHRHIHDIASDLGSHVSLVEL